MSVLVSLDPQAGPLDTADTKLALKEDLLNKWRFSSRHNS